MDTKNIITEDKKSKLVAFFSAITIAFAITAAIFVCYAIILTYTNIGEKNLSLIITITSIISISVAGFNIAKSLKKRGWLWGIIVGLFYAITLLIISYITFNKLIFNMQTIMLFLLAAASGCFGGIIGINFSNKNEK